MVRVFAHWLPGYPGVSGHSRVTQYGDTDLAWIQLVGCPEKAMSPDYPSGGLPVPVDSLQKTLLHPLIF